MDDQQLFKEMSRVKGRFIIRACHNRLIEVYNASRHSWETRLLEDYAAQVPALATVRVAFHHAHEVRVTEVSLSWFALRLPETRQRLSALVAYDPDYDRYLTLLSNFRLTEAKTAIAAYGAWRFRPRIEHTYRFDQEGGLNVEELRVRTLERMRRVFVLVLLAARTDPLVTATRW